MMNKTIATLLLLLGLTTTSWAQDFESATEAVENMRVGWNLGNTLDSNSNDTLNMWIEHWTSRMPSDYETAWGQPVTRPELFEMMRQAGFNAIRVPVTWYPHMEARYKFTSNDHSNWSPAKDDIGTQIQKAWMKRVREVVDYVISQGMYCILNVHHDTGAESAAWLIADEAVYEQQHTRFEAIWQQIALEFKDYDEHLLFEGYNEMLDTKRSWCFASFAAPNNYNATIAKSAYSAINKYAQTFVNTVRATGGNNAQRNLIVSTYGACDGLGNWSTHLLEPLKEMKLPDDAAKNHLIFEVHSYPDASNLSNAKNSLQTCINNLKRHLVAKGAPVIFGEWAPTNVDNDLTKRTSFIKYFAETAKANQMGLFYWMGLSDGKHRSVPEFNEQELVDAMMEGFYGKGGYVDAIASPSSVSPTNSRYYNLLGQPVRPTHPGLLIRNGRKFINR